MATVFAWASAMPARSPSRFLLCARRAHFALAKLVGLVVQQSAQVSCHDAPIFRLLLKIAVSLRSSNVTFSIFVWLLAANISSSRRFQFWQIIFCRVAGLRPSRPFCSDLVGCRWFGWSTYLAGAGPRSSRWLSIG